MQHAFKASVLALLTATAMAAPLGASAQVSVNVNLPGIVTIAPPAPRVERIPAPRSGQIWIGGHWSWNSNDYVWRPGYWQAARPDHDYAPGRWVQANGGYRWVEGQWKPHPGKGNGGCPPGQAKKGRC
jgi:hypothetical protein